MDVADAFHQVPLSPDGYRVTVVMLGDACFCFRVLAFGAASAPTAWARFAALLGRSTAVVVNLGTLRLAFYVDDPLYVAGGGLRTRAFAAALLGALAV
eukprot:6898047-Alexandrium_andersonii.AAC.1